MDLTRTIKGTMTDLFTEAILNKIPDGFCCFCNSPIQPPNLLACSDCHNLIQKENQRLKSKASPFDV